jgi:hypothetical protein
VAGRMNLDDSTQVLRVYVDELLGQDGLRKFRTLRIEYHAIAVELEKKQRVGFGQALESLILQ